MRRPAWPRTGAALPPLMYDPARDSRLDEELAIVPWAHLAPSLARAAQRAQHLAGHPLPGGSWAPRCRVDDPPAGVLELFGEYVELGKGEHLAVGWEGEHPSGGRIAIRARLVRFRPDGTAAYVEGRLPGPGWGGTWEIAVRLGMERSAVRARIALAAVPMLRDWLGRDTTAATRAATMARQKSAAQRAVKAEALRAAGMTIEQAAEAVDRDPSTIGRYRTRLKTDSRIS